MGFASDGDCGLTVYYMNERIERCRVFAQALALIEGKHGHGSGFFLYDLSTYDGAGLVLDKLGCCAIAGAIASVTASVTASRAGWVGCVVVGRLVVAGVTHGLVPLVEVNAVAVDSARDVDDSGRRFGVHGGGVHKARLKRLPDVRREIVERAG